MRIAVLEDDVAQLMLTRSVIESLGHDCHVFSSGRQILRALRRESFDLLVLDWGVPDLSGMEVVKWVRASMLEHLPVLFITNHVEERDIVEALRAGADDYMSKPARIPELQARIAALLRRAYPMQNKDVQVYGDYSFNNTLSTLEIKGVPVELKSKEWKLAQVLFSNLGRLMSRQYLQDAVWGHTAEVASRSLNTHVSQLRLKLNLRPENGFRLTSIYSMGYRLEMLPAGEAADADVGDGIDLAPRAGEAPQQEPP